MGQDVSAETCPHYLFKSEEEAISARVFGKINPPIREKNEQNELWNAIKDGILTIVGSDHAVFTLDEKNTGKENFSSAPPGTPAGELLLPLMMNASFNGKISIEKVAELLSTNPAKRFNLYPKKGVIAKNSDADLIVFDESTNALDLETEEKIIEDIYKLKNNRIIIFITHRTGSLKKCDKILSLDEGKLTTFNSFEKYKNY